MNKEEKMEIQKIEYLENKKRFLHEITFLKFFIIIQGLSFGEKMKNNRHKL